MNTAPCGGAFALAVLLVAAGAGAGCDNPVLSLEEAILVTEAVVDFGPVAVGTERSVSLRIENTGNKDLTITDALLVGDQAFSLTTGEQTTVAPGTAVSWYLGFAPVAAVAASATLVIQSDSKDASLTEVALRGLGVESCQDEDGDGYGVNCPQGPDCNDADATLNPDTLWYPDFDEDTYGDPAVPLTQCAQPSGYVSNAEDCDDLNPNVAPTFDWYRDGDSDGFGDAATVLHKCVQPPGYVSNPNDCDDDNSSAALITTWYADADTDTYGNPDAATQACGQPAGHVADSTDCDDTNAAYHPGATWFMDQDGDTYGDPGRSQVACAAPAGHVADSSDCNDGDAARHPGATWYRDADQDTYGNANEPQTACAPLPGYVANAEDCNDTNAAINPNAVWYQDLDDDTYGNPLVSQVSCAQPSGYVSNGRDCDDTSAAVVPGTTFYADTDGDTYGDPATGMLACTAPPGHVLDNTDCNDASAQEHPGAVWYLDADHDTWGDAGRSQVACAPPADHVANNLDCDDGEATVGTTRTWYQDFDSDTFGNAAVSVVSCPQPAGYVADDSDCNDTNALVNPNGTESGATLCNDGLDNDCDQEPDSFDSACAHVDCGEPANYLTTGACNEEYPYGVGPAICEQYPNSPWPPGSQEQCMASCRTSSECPAGQACYPSRRSLNDHFCAPVLGVNLVPKGGACTSDAMCATALCEANVCRDVCVRDADCDGGQVCRAAIRNHAYIGNDIATGICVPTTPGLAADGAVCGGASQCQHGICGQSFTGGPYICRRICGSENDCPTGQRCGASFYNLDPSVGYGLRACGEVPSPGTVRNGDSCYLAATGYVDGNCRSFFCDATYCPDPYSASNCLIESYCNGFCDQDTDCPELLPGAVTGVTLKMRCLMTSSAIIQPLISGYCVPHWCETNADCVSGACFIFNATHQYGLASGICQG